MTEEDCCGPVTDFAEVTKSDSVILSGVRALYVGEAGDVAVRSSGSSTTVTFRQVPTGAILPIQVEKVMAATTAADIVALLRNENAPTITLSAPTLTPQASPTTYPPAPSYGFNAPDIHVGDNVRLWAAPTYADAIARTNLTVNDATVTLTGVDATDKAALNAKLTGISAGISYIAARIERSGGSVFGAASNIVQHGTAAVPTVTSGLTADVYSSLNLSDPITLSAPVADIQISGNDMVHLELVGARPGASFTLRWKNDGTKSYTSPDDFDLDRVYDYALTVTGLNGVVGSPQTGAITLLDYDTLADTPSFTDVTNATRSTAYESNTITVAGLVGGYTGHDGNISGGEYSKNGGAYSSATPFSYTNGDTFKMRQTSSASYLTATNTVFSLGAASDTYTVTTQADPAAIAPTFHAFTVDELGFGAATSVHSVVLKAGLNVLCVGQSLARVITSATCPGMTSGPTKVASVSGDQLSFWEVVAPSDSTGTFTVNAAANFQDVAVCAVHLGGAAAGPTETDTLTTNYYPDPQTIGNGTTVGSGDLTLAMCYTNHSLTWTVGTEAQSAAANARWSLAYLTTSGTPTFEDGGYSGEAGLAANWSY